MTLLTTGEGEKVHEPEPVKIPGKFDQSCLHSIPILSSFHSNPVFVPFHPEDVLQQHQLLAEKGEEVKKLRTDIQGHLRETTALAFE